MGPTQRAKSRTPEYVMSWTDERVETLKRMWAEGQSASQIAKELGGVTRNAVIGKVHRLGLSNRAGDGAAHGEEAEAPAVAPAAAVRPDPAPRPAPAPEPVAPRAAEPAAPPRPAVERPAPQPAAAAPASGATITPLPIRKAIIPAGQPLPRPPPPSSRRCRSARRSSRQANRCRRSPRPMRSAPRRWPRSARWKSGPAS